MALHLKVTACLLLFAHVCHLASLQETTLSPGRTIDKSWLRVRVKDSSGSANAVAHDGEREYNADGKATEFGGDYSGGMASGSMAVSNSEEDNLSGQEAGETKASDVTTVMSPTFPNGTADESDSSNTTVAMTTVAMTTGSTNSSQVNVKGTDEESNNSTTTSSTSSPQFSNQTDLETSTLAPKINESIANPDAGSNTTTTTTVATTPTVAATTTVATTTTPQDNRTTTSTSTTQAFPDETTGTTAEPTTPTATNTPEMVNRTDKGSASGSGTDRGLASDAHRTTRNKAWAAVLGTAVVVVCIGLAAYIMLRHKHQKGFSHRKLVEEFPSDPVLRLDNSEPLDLNFGGAAYYNPALQGDNIQMTNFARHHRK